MYYVIAKWLVKVLKEKGYIKEHEKMMYTIVEYVLTFFVNLLVASGIGHTFQIENQLIVFSIFYSILRISNGGNYLKLDIKSAVTRWVLGVVLILVAEVIAFDVRGKWIMMFFLLISFIAVAAFAPYRMNKVSIPNAMKQKLWKKSIVTVTTLCVLLAIGLLLLESNIVTSAIIGVFVQSISLLPAPKVNRQVIELENYAV